MELNGGKPPDKIQSFGHEYKLADGSKKEVKSKNSAGWGNPIPLSPTPR
jgi:hypothetical protein